MGNKIVLGNVKDNRTVYFDYLRVFSTFAVIILHTASFNWYIADVNSYDWQVLNFFDSIVRWSVPVFVMISGALFLQRDIPLRVIYKKYIKRMIIAFFCWSTFYSIFERGDLSIKIGALIKGHYHMWFICMIVGIYMCIPFIKPIVENEARIKYYLLLSFVFALVIPEAVMLINDFGNDSIIQAINNANNIVNNMHIHIVLGYGFYFVLGYYLNNIYLEKRKRVVIYFAGAFGFVFTIIVSLIVSLKTQQNCANYYGYFNVNVMLEALAVFVFFRHRDISNNKLNLIIQKMSGYCFGAYLIHAFIIERLSDVCGISTFSFNPLFSLPCIAFFVFVLSFIISGIINHIPVIGKYIV